MENETTIQHPNNSNVNHIHREYDSINIHIMKRDLIIIAALSSMIVATIILTSFFYIATIDVNEEVEEIEVFEFVEPKDWFLDSTLTEKRHIYYETQFKMK